MPPPMVTFGAPMSVSDPNEQSRKSRRGRLAKRLILGGVAIGVPALVNLAIARSARRLGEAKWGRPSRYSWRYGEISFQVLGKGEPILLLHSLGPGHDGDEWCAVAELLAESHTVYVPDLLGWGRSQRPKIAYDDSIYVRLISDFLDDVVWAPSTLVAAGLTAPYALQVALDEPQKVEAVGLVHPSGLDLDAEEPDLRDALLRKALQVPVLGTGALNLYTSHQAIKQHLERDVFLEPQAVTDEDVEQYYDSSHQPGAHHALASYLAGFLNHRLRHGVDRLQQPLWLAWGRGGSNPVVRQQLDTWLNHFPAAEIEVLDGVGSLPHFESPATFGDRLLRFLTQTPASIG